MAARQQGISGTLHLEDLINADGDFILDAVWLYQSFKSVVASGRCVRRL